MGSEASQGVQVETGEGVAIVTMARPPANGLTPEFVAELDRVRQRLEADHSIGCAVLTSGLPKIFCAGAEAAWVARGCEERGDRFVDDFERFTASLTYLCHALFDSRLVWIAAINGHCIAGGLELALSCDLRVASDRAGRFALPEMTIFGAVPSGGGALQQLVRTVGRARAIYVIATGEPFSPEQAHEWGIVDELTPADGLLQRVHALAGRIATPPVPAGIPGLKRALDAASVPPNEARRIDREVFEEQLREPSFTAGLKTFAAQFGKRR